MTAQQKLNARVANLSTAALKDMAGKMVVSDREGSEIVLSAVLDALMGRLPDAEFVAFCEGAVMPFAKIISFEQFAAQEGASRQAFGDAGLHRSAERMSRRTWGRIVEHQARLDEALADRRGELRAEYQRLVSEGHILEPDAQQRLEAAADGEGERAAAARRILAKKAARRAALQSTPNDEAGFMPASPISTPNDE